ncbi:MAG: hypothetical protein LBU05_02790, partial [Bifidobacteriaceae bacterium]|nr:hypothetical protein [Bifidobacteriaceae bacterium]
MMLLRDMAVEFRKLIGSKATWTAYAIGITGPTLFAALNAQSIRAHPDQADFGGDGPEEVAFSVAPVGVVAATLLAIVGIVVMAVLSLPATLGVTWA